MTDNFLAYKGYLPTHIISFAVEIAGKCDHSQYLLAANIPNVLKVYLDQYQGNLYLKE